MITEINGVKVMMNPMLGRGRGVIMSNTNTTFLGRYDMSNLLLSIDGDYKQVFETVGINNDSLDACIFEAKKRVNRFINRSNG